MYGVAGRLGERREGRGTKAEMGGTEKERESEPCRYMYQISTLKGGRYIVAVHARLCMYIVFITNYTFWSRSNVQTTSVRYEPISHLLSHLNQGQCSFVIEFWLASMRPMASGRRCYMVAVR